MAFITWVLKREEWESQEDDLGGAGRARGRAPRRLLPPPVAALALHVFLLQRAAMPGHRAGRYPVSLGHFNIYGERRTHHYTKYSQGETQSMLPEPVRFRGVHSAYA